jgi:hypothetical protein
MKPAILSEFEVSGHVGRERWIKIENTAIE